MGGIVSKFRSDLVLIVKTGDRKGAGTDANVYAFIEDSNGNQTPETKLDTWFHNDHERNSSGAYGLPSGCKKGRVSKSEPSEPCELGEPAFLVLWRDRSGFADDWFVERIELRSRSTRKTLAVWPLHRWIKPDKKYRFTVNDCVLPQKDTSSNQRLEELQERRGFFELSQNLEGAPPQCRYPPLTMCPPDVREFTSLRARMEHKIIAGATSAWRSLDDLKNIYKLDFQEPAVMHRWKCDTWFAAQRLQGINPLAIKLCTQLPECFKSSRNGMPMSMNQGELTQAIQERKLFVIDHRILRNLPCKDDRMVVAPVGLFCVSGRGDLRPVAIHLFPDSASDNPLFSPADPPYTWILAKMFFNMADAMIHRSWLWYGMCHLLPESIWVSANRCLSNSHPIYKLLAPHLAPVIGANSNLQRELLSPGGWIDSTTTVGVRGFQAIIGRSFEDFHIIDDVDIRKVIARNGTDVEALQDYPFRDDAIEVQEALREYVRKILNNYYDGEGDITEDRELASWLDEMGRSRREAGCQIRGIPSPVDRDGLLALLTSVLSLATLFNAAFGVYQYDELAFPPNYPSTMRGIIPRDNHPRSEGELVGQLPSKEATLSWLSVVRFLSTRPSNCLGQISDIHLSHAADVEALLGLQQRLRQISKCVKLLNESRKFAYSALDPENIPNAIEI
ncbi:allene oxide synthase-lipoxygenase protein-like [Tropilaelaps mercedesae]|uniref:Allene oxide synthase-lipoxygenase protein-like n=1 Tax=Tropilaelaps mercedesae TaxID=418985 RepID=A0A1V9X7B0_9ACAR|nr:allene oxide synthase-lipoxygenase protein-like [Tropilaelaps mercedesae]